MNRDTLNTAIKEAERFLARAKAVPGPVERAPAEWAKDGKAWIDDSIPPKDSGAVRRASMDLTRALADLRKQS
ncbi:hypothetical protein [Sphingomonas sp. CARO-RG-8B-R24-01]|uniref:hypothetical protein n=1 Tax=Sphingomonas sp. CARO-RG-8B-R24-01 TaxID=2914831 RepID=UPI001F55B3C6|nr:hypothetical protein [Sphingomonas sp. CARO-RG-8B-R24-01]